MKHQSIRKFRLGIALSLICMSLTSTAEMLVSNLDEIIDDYTIFNAGDRAGTQFYTGTDSYTLESVVLSMHSGTGTDDRFSVGIYSDSGDEPGMLLETLSGDGNPISQGLYTYTSAGLSLAADTSYWVIASASGNSYRWKHPHDVGFTEKPGSGATLGKYAESTGGSAWTSYYADPPRSMAVNVVPEPATLGLLVLSAVGIGVFRRFYAL